MPTMSSSVTGWRKKSSMLWSRCPVSRSSRALRPFAFKGQNTYIRRIADILGVTHVLEGSVRRAGNRIRVTAQLIAAADGSHLWSERYDRQMDDLFAVQGEIAEAIAGELKLKIAPAAH